MTQRELPPRSADALQHGERVYRTALPSHRFIELEQESLARGITPYVLVKILMIAYLDGRLVYVKELPDNLQEAIKRFQEVTKFNEQKRAVSVS